MDDHGSSILPISMCTTETFNEVAEHVVKKGATPPPEVVEAAVNLEKRVEELQQNSRLNLSAEQISSCEAYSEK